MEEKKKKEYSFTLLLRRPMWMRVDLIAVTIVTAYVLGYFGWQLTDKEDLLAMGSMVLAALVNGVLLLGNHWWVVYHETIAY